MWFLLLIAYIMSYFYVPSASESVGKLPSVGSVYRSSSPPQQNAWIGSAITAGASFIGGLFGNKSQNKNIDKQIAAQKEENQKNRDYNLMLAQKQNAWNVEQWERENAYNDPQAQLDRMRKAGINPDLAVGGGYQNTAASSPAMTAGAASTAQDMSVLGQRPTLGQAIQSALHDSMLGAQIDNIKANTRKTLADANISEVDAKYRDREKELGVNINQRVYEKLEHEIDKAFEDARAASYNVEKLNYEQMNARLEHLYKDRELQAIIKKLENEADISEQDAKLAAESYTYRFLGIKSEAELAKFNAALPRSLEEKFGEDADNMALLLQAVSFILNNAGNLKTMKSLKK